MKTVKLTKRYPGVAALKGVDLAVERGRIVGLLGPNGSGKSTLMRIAAEQSRPSRGEIYIKGVDPGPETRALVSYSPEYDHLYEWMNVTETVDFLAPFFPSLSWRRGSYCWRRFPPWPSWSTSAGFLSTAGTALQELFSLTPWPAWLYCLSVRRDIFFFHKMPGVNEAAAGCIACIKRPVGVK